MAVTSIMRSAQLTVLLLSVVTNNSATASTAVEVNQLDGQKISATLIAIGRDQVTIGVGNANESRSVRDLYSLRFPDIYLDATILPPENPKQITFTDGSVLQATELAIEGGRATITLDENTSLVASTRSLKTVRFFAPTPELAGQWQSIESAENPSGDVLVIRKVRVVEDQDGIEQQIIGLDSLTGVIYEVNDAEVGFEFDGTRVSVPRHKVEGLIYFRQSSSQSTVPTSQVLQLDGSKWNLRSCESDGDRLKGVTVGGVRMNISLATVTKVDYSIGNLVFISDLQPATFEWKSDLATTRTPSVVNSWYRLRKDEGFFGGSLMLGSQSFEKGLALHSHTKLAYRLTQDFTRFMAIAGIDVRHQDEGNVTLKILGNGKELLSESISGTKQVNIDLNVNGLRRLEIIVDFGDDEVGYGDYLNLGNARLLK